MHAPLGLYRIWHARKQYLVIMDVTAETWYSDRVFNTILGN